MEDMRDVGAVADRDPARHLPGRDDTATSRGANRIVAVFAKPPIIGGLLALLGINLSTVPPAWGIDSSFRVGLTEAVLERLEFGVDVVWPYGPLGFLGGPTVLDRWLLAAAVVYQLVALTVLFTTLVVHFRRLGIGLPATVAVLTPFAVAISIADNIVPEVVSITVLVVLVVLGRQDRPGRPTTATWWVLALAGFVSGAQVLVKFGPGLMASAIVVWFAASTAERFRRLPVAAAAIVAGFVVPWYATGQATSALSPYFSTSWELSSGYQTAQAWGPFGGRMAVIGVVAVVVAAVGVFGAIRWARHDRRAVWTCGALALAAWFTLKQGLVRWDQWHVVGALLILGLIVVVIPWDRRTVALPLGAMVVGVLATFGAEPSRLKSTWSYRTDAALALVSSQQQSDQIAAATADVRSRYAVPAEVIQALAGGSVHAEAWDGNAVWAYGLDWRTLPVLQSYSTYTAALDRLNAGVYASPSGPAGVLLNPTTVDDRYGLWESPDARVALACHFVPVAQSGNWTALRRESNICGPARELRTDRIAPGETVSVPEPSRPNALVVARFELPSDPVGRILATVARPVRYARVAIGGTDHRLVTGTAESAHLLRSPGQVGDRALPFGRLAEASLAFGNVGSGTITVRFEEIPLDNS